MSSFRLLATSRLIAFVLAAMGLISIEVLVTYTAAFSRHPVGLSIGILIDFVCVTPALFYWLVARPLRLAGSRALLVALVMLRVAWFILPATAFPTNTPGPALLIVAEGSVLIMFVLRVRRIAGTYRRLRAKTDIETALRDSLATAVSKRAASVMISEGLIFYYVLFGWWVRSDVPSEALPLSTHRQSGQVALTTGLLLAGLIESVGAHLVLTHWIPAVAIGVTILSVYGLLFLVADILATMKRPSCLTPTHLRIRLGIRWRSQIPRSLIADVSRIHEKPAKQPDQLNAAFLTAPNVLLTFHESVCVDGPYGIQKNIRQLSFFVDDPSTLAQSLTRRDIFR